MSVFLTEDKKEIIITCKCGCEQAFHIAMMDDWKDLDYYSFMCFMRANYDTEYSLGPWRAFKVKIKKIWSILIGKDYCYSDILMSSEDLKKLKEYIYTLIEQAEGD